MRFIDQELTLLDLDVKGPEEAIREAGNLLYQQSLIQAKYIDAMVDSYRKFGPYFVLAPNIALPHARPEDGVMEASVSFLRLKKPVRFGHSTNDPVRLVFALGASSSEEHLKLLQRLILLLNHPENIGKLIEAKDYEEIKSLVKGGE